MLDYFLVTSSYIQSVLAAFQVHSPWPSGYLMALAVPPLVSLPSILSQEFIPPPFQLLYLRSILPP